ncbi:endonuclease-reverse transcriptase [Plakobranchus ocellatus]|uniref:Endonuclease-reverse transcriptase n=1 Tax=Plakobranchus ocellatus TaxID=259542 RepID=A0AAV4B5I9_9GAST|nr:endonuclease-reverse transcriptase [Plakobranchus ocellatus]
MHKEQFQLGISHRFNVLEENKPTIETFHKIMEEEAERFGKNGKDKPNYEKAFDSVEHETIVQALRKVNINGNYVTMIENICKRATAKIHIDNQISEAFETQRGVRQGDPISPKLFITVIEQVFKETDLKYGINIGGEYLRDLRFADDVALCTEKEEEMEEHLERLNSESKKSRIENS